MKINENQKNAPVCKNCGIFDSGAIQTGKCPNCDCNYFEKED